MDSDARKKHLQESVAAGSIMGLAAGVWLGARASHAGWIEWLAFCICIMFAPAFVLSRIDARFNYEDEP